MRGTVKYLILLIASLMAASCVFDADRCDMLTDKPYGVRFTVSLSNHQTRASWNDEYPSEYGVVFDYRIIPDELRLVIYTKGGTRLGVIDDLDYWPINESHTEFQFMGEMPDEFLDYLAASGEPEPVFRFMVLANCSDDISDEENITYSQAMLDPANEESAIPMWGVKEADVSLLYTTDNIDIGNISLLRAAARIEVKLSDALKKKGTTINSANLKYYNQTGYVYPSGWSQATTTKGLDQENCLRIYRHAAINMPFIEDKNTGDFYLYVTEYDNINYAGERNKISLEFNVDGKNKYFEDAISFCVYQGGAPVENSHYNIVRNHIYEFEIQSIAGSSLLLEYTVADWVTEDWDGNGQEYEEHDLSYPTYHNPVVPFEYLMLDAVEQANYKISNELEPKMYYSAGNNEIGGFHCYFQILAPESVEWKPVFMGSKENYRIRVYHVNKNLQQEGNAIYDTGDNKLQENLGVCDAGEWFHIIVFPLSDDGANTTEVEFGISYYQVWTDQYINLYVNGEYGNIRWPNSGSNPKIINIRHTSEM